MISFVSCHSFKVSFKLAILSDRAIIHRRTLSVKIIYCLFYKIEKIIDKGSGSMSTPKKNRRSQEYENSTFLLDLFQWPLPRTWNLLFVPLIIDSQPHVHFPIIPKYLHQRSLFYDQLDL